MFGFTERRLALVQNHVELARTVLTPGPTSPLDPLSLVRNGGRDDEHPTVSVRFFINDLNAWQRIVNANLSQEGRNSEAVLPGSHVRGRQSDRSQ